MKIFNHPRLWSAKPRHWFGIAIALAAVIVAIISFADFSGEPASHWRKISMMILPPLTFLAVGINLLLDKRGQDRRE